MVKLYPQHPINKMTSRVLLALLCFLGHISYAQIAADYQKYKEQYPNSQSVRLKQEAILNISFSKGQFEISQEWFEEDLYLYESAKYDAKQSLNYSSFIELDQIEASSLVIRNNKYEELKVTEFKEKDELDEYFYDDNRSVNFIFPSLGQGSITKLKYKQTIKNPRFLNSYFFGSFYPIENNTLTILADKNIQLRFQEVNMKGISVEFTKKRAGRHNVYTWETKNMPEYKYDERAPDYKSILPHIIPIIVSYEKDGETVKLPGRRFRSIFVVLFSGRKFESGACNG